MDLDRATSRLRSFFTSPSPAAPLQEAVKVPSHVAYVHWGFGSPAEVMEWDLTVVDDPGSTTGEYLALFNGSIDGSQCYLGLQTDVHHPGTGRGTGKGLIFSTWWSFDEADTRAAADGFVQLGTHEGTFVGVRRSHPWTAGDYRVTLRRSEEEIVRGRVLDWFDLTIAPLRPVGPGPSRPDPVAPAEWIGGLRFPRRRRGTPACIDPGGLLFLEVYGQAPTWGEVDRWSVDVMAFADGVRCPAGRNEYPRFPHGQQAPNVDVRYDPARQRVRLSLGTGVVKEHPPARWP